MLNLHFLARGGRCYKLLSYNIMECFFVPSFVHIMSINKEDFILQDHCIIHEYGNSACVGQIAWLTNAISTAGLSSQICYCGHTHELSLKAVTLVFMHKIWEQIESILLFFAWMSCPICTIWEPCYFSLWLVCVCV